MITVEYERGRAVAYAKKWALSRNPEFYDYSDIGGNCTNFASQCVYAGSGVMNYTPDFGWYYIDANDKSPSWTGVQFFYDFMTSNEGVGPFAEETVLQRLLPGDIIQLGNEEDVFYHTVVLAQIKRTAFGIEYLICAQSNDAYMRPLSSYDFYQLRGIHILGVRKNVNSIF